MLLYKYRTDSERTEEIIKKNEVWFAKPETLNDPLECSIQEIAEKSIVKFCEQEKQEQLEGFVLTYTMIPEHKLLWGLSKKEVKNVLEKMGKANGVDAKYRIYANFIKSRTGNYPSNPVSKYMYITDILKNVGIFSLSETCESELMWGHYADGGKGIAIGFDIQENSSLTYNSLCLKVNYTNEAVILKDRIKPTLAMAIGENGNPLYFQAPAFDDPFLKEVMSTKNTTWEYENEWRCVEQMPGLKTVIAPIAEVVFGIKCPQDIREKYIALAHKYFQNSISFFEIVLDGRTFKRKILIK